MQLVDFFVGVNASLFLFHMLYFITSMRIQKVYRQGAQDYEKSIIKAQWGSPRRR